jgi:hypothetical protein
MVDRQFHIEFVAKLSSGRMPGSERVVWSSSSRSSRRQDMIRSRRKDGSRRDGPAAVGQSALGSGAWRPVFATRRTGAFLVDPPSTAHQRAMPIAMADPRPDVIAEPAFPYLTVRSFPYVDDRIRGLGLGP